MRAGLAKRIMWIGMETHLLDPTSGIPPHFFHDGDHRLGMDVFPVGLR
jgi:hypothetical protein